MKTLHQNVVIISVNLSQSKCQELKPSFDEMSVAKEALHSNTIGSNNNSRQESKEDANKKMVHLVETHFSDSPITNSEVSSPKNGFTSIEGTNLLQEELNRLLLKEEKKEQHSAITFDGNSIDDLQSPTDENINMFVRMKSNNFKSNLSEEQEKIIKEENTAEVSVSGKLHFTLSIFFTYFPHCFILKMLQIWTLLDCHFGIPLFDVNANTKICDVIISGGLCEPNR